MSLAGLQKVSDASLLRCRMNLHGAFGSGAELVASETYLQQFAFGGDSGCYLIDSGTLFEQTPLTVLLGSTERAFAEKVLELKT